MKIVTWAIIFVIVIFAFSFGNRVILNNKLEIIKEEVKYNNAVDQATVDSTTRLMQQMVNLNEETNESQYIILSAIDKFFETFSLSLGYYGGEVKQSSLKVFVPLIMVMTDDGYYSYTQEEMKATTTSSYVEHTLKPEVPYADTIIDGTRKIYLNYTIDNHIKVFINGIMYEGNLVDISHLDDCTIPPANTHHDETLADGTVVNFSYSLTDIGNDNKMFTKIGKYRGKDIRYSKKIEEENNVRYLYEYWYIDNIEDGAAVKVRVTEYTFDDYIFTNQLRAALEDYNMSEETCDFLTEGNPENTGMEDPFTGEKILGDFHRKRRSAISSNVISKAEQYVLKHNDFARMNGISYTFILPEIEDTDWDNALQDVTILSFVQGMPLAGETYYNNYSFSGARIVKRETFQALPIRKAENGNLNLTDATDQNAENFPVYYSSYGFNDTQINLLEANGSKLFYYAQAAANEGYYPYIGQYKATVDELEETVYFLNIDLTVDTEATPRGPRLPGEEMQLKYTISSGGNNNLNIVKIAYMEIGNGRLPSNEYILANGTVINNPGLTGTFRVPRNGTYVIAVEEDTAYQTCSDKVVIDDFDTEEFTEYTNLSLTENLFIGTWNETAILASIQKGSVGIYQITWRNVATGATGLITKENINGKQDTFMVPENGTYEVTVYSAAYGNTPNPNGLFKNTKQITVIGVEKPFSMNATAGGGGMSATITLSGTNISTPSNTNATFKNVTIKKSNGQTVYNGSLSSPYGVKVYENDTYTVTASNSSGKQNTTSTPISVTVSSIEDFGVNWSQNGVNLTASGVNANISRVVIVALAEDGTTISTRNQSVNASTYTYTATESATYTITAYAAGSNDKQFEVHTFNNVVVPIVP